MPKLPEAISAADQCREMGREDFYSDYPQSYIHYVQFFGPKSLAYAHWIEGWEMAAVEAHCEAEEMKQRCLLAFQQKLFT